MVRPPFWFRLVRLEVLARLASFLRGALLPHHFVSLCPSPKKYRMRVSSSDDLFPFLALLSMPWRLNLLEDAPLKSRGEWPGRLWEPRSRVFYCSLIFWAGALGSTGALVQFG